MSLKVSMLCVLVLASAGCNGSEVGNPPFEPEAFTPFVDPPSIELVPDPAGAGQLLLRFPEASLPGIVQMSLIAPTRTELERPLSRRDGAFEATIAQPLRGEPADQTWLRVFARTAEERVSPLDLLVRSDGTLELIRPSDSCIELERREILAPEGAQVRVRNRCAEPLSLEAHFRLGDWSVEPSVVVVAPGEVVSLETLSFALSEDDTLVLEGADQPAALTFRR